MHILEIYMYINIYMEFNTPLICGIIFMSCSLFQPVEDPIMKRKLLAFRV